MRNIKLIALALCALACSACGSGGGPNPIFFLPSGFNDQVQLSDSAVNTIISQPENPGSIAISDGGVLEFRTWLLERTDGNDFDVEEVTDEADYVIISGNTVVQFLGDGRLLGLSPGSAVIEAAFQGNQCRLTVIVN
jgi:hypothetical protein